MYLYELNIYDYVVFFMAYVRKEISDIIIDLNSSMNLNSAVCLFYVISGKFGFK